MNTLVQLWSYHLSDFSLIKGCVDPEKSGHARRYRAAYERLWGILGTAQFIWCCTSRECWRRQSGYCEWQLEVPQNQILRIVDCMVWNGILGTRAEPPRPLRTELLVEAMAEFPDAPDTAYKWYEERLNQLWSPKGDPWESLFLSDPQDLKADILLEHPIDPSWVLETRAVDL